MNDRDALRALLLRLENASYGAYKDLQQTYRFAQFSLFFDRIQGDPFAAPSRLRARVPQTIARLPASWRATPSRTIALRDFLTRTFATAAARLSDRRGTGKSGILAMPQPGQEILARSAVVINDDWVEARFVAGLPARGRRILGQQAAAMLCDIVPELVGCSLLASALDLDALNAHIATAEDADWLRSQLGGRGLVAFAAAGARLPRRSGVDPRPLARALPLEVPDALAVEFDLPNGGRVRGLGIPAGVTLIVGGGFHGKSTLLRALELGVYAHIPGDGRERVVTAAAAVKIRAEDGRSVTGVDISPFINDLPQGRSTTHFSTANASGSTSQAANIIEALEAGARVLLIDEDTAATNFMIRDRRMQQLVAKTREPIVPLIDKIRQLYDELGVSSVLVMGGSGDYFDVADTVIALENYQPQDVTARAKAIATAHPSDRTPEGGDRFGRATARVPLLAALDPSRGKQATSVKIRTGDEIAFGTEDIDLSAVEQLVDPGQLRAIAAALVCARERYGQSRHDMPELLDRLQGDLDGGHFELLASPPPGDFVGFRRFELAAALNRLRSLQIEGCIEGSKNRSSAAVPSSSTMIEVSESSSHS